MSGVSNIAAEMELEPEFQAWPKTSRQPVWMRVTEKIDGTNGCVIVTSDHRVYAQSRTRILTPGNDNFGFGAWVSENAAELVELGPGYWYGEWWGRGIQRGYGLDDRHFSLFAHWLRDDSAVVPECVSLVPELYRGAVTAWDWSDDAYSEGVFRHGSYAATGFKDPEGLVVEYITGRAILRQKIVISEWRGGKGATRG